MWIHSVGLVESVNWSVVIFPDPGPRPNLALQSMQFYPWKWFNLSLITYMFLYGKLQVFYLHFWTNHILRKLQFNLFYVHIKFTFFELAQVAVYKDWARNDRVRRVQVQMQSFQIPQHWYINSQCRRIRSKIRTGAVCFWSSWIRIWIH